MPFAKTSGYSTFFSILQVLELAGAIVEAQSAMAIAEKREIKATLPLSVSAKDAKNSLGLIWRKCNTQSLAQSPILILERAWRRFPLQQESQAGDAILARGMVRTRPMPPGERPECAPSVGFGPLDCFGFARNEKKANEGPERRSRSDQAAASSPAGVRDMPGSPGSSAWDLQSCA